LYSHPTVAGYKVIGDEENFKDNSSGVIVKARLSKYSFGEEKIECPSFEGC